MRTSVDGASSRERNAEPSATGGDVWPGDPEPAARLVAATPLPAVRPGVEDGAVALLNECSGPEACGTKRVEYQQWMETWGGWPVEDDSDRLSCRATPPTPAVNRCSGSPDEYPPHNPCGPRGRQTQPLRIRRGQPYSSLPPPAHRRDYSLRRGLCLRSITAPATGRHRTHRPQSCGQE